MEASEQLLNYLKSSWLEDLDNICDIVVFSLKLIYWQSNKVYRTVPSWEVWHDPLLSLFHSPLIQLSPVRENFTSNDDFITGNGGILSPFTTFNRRNARRRNSFRFLFVSVPQQGTNINHSCSIQRQKTWKGLIKALSTYLRNGNHYFLESNPFGLQCTLLNSNAAAQNISGTCFPECSSM